MVEKIDHIDRPLYGVKGFKEANGKRILTRNRATKFWENDKKALDMKVEYGKYFSTL